MNNYNAMIRKTNKTRENRLHTKNQNLRQVCRRRWYMCSWVGSRYSKPV